jgi:glycine C-acetyltransferase
MIFVDALSASLDVVTSKPELREKMWHIAGLLQNGLKELGYDIGDTCSPITPVYVPAGDVETGMAMLRMLREDYGVFVSGVMYPVVPLGVALFRMIPTASHTEEDVSKTLEAYKQMRDRMKLDLSLKPSRLNR